jgi:hypothetical protein
MADYVYTIRSLPMQAEEQTVEIPPGEAITVDADRFGHVLFREEPVKVTSDKIQDGLQKCLEVAKTIVSKTSQAIENYEVDTITLKLALDAGVGVVFVGDAKIKAGIEIEIKRVTKKANADGDPIQ